MAAGWCAHRAGCSATASALLLSSVLCIAAIIWRPLYRSGDSVLLLLLRVLALGAAGRGQVAVGGRAGRLRGLLGRAGGQRIGSCVVLCDVTLK